jgi:hypothetical protein
MTSSRQRYIYCKSSESILCTIRALAGSHRVIRKAGAIHPRSNKKARCVRRANNSPAAGFLNQRFHVIRRVPSARLRRACFRRDSGTDGKNLKTSNGRCAINRPCRLENERASLKCVLCANVFMGGINESSGGVEASVLCKNGAPNNPMPNYCAPPDSFAECSIHLQ